jgi:nucleoid DNA-binding protein
VSKRKARKGRNPRAGDVIKIAAKKVPVFKAGKGLKEAVK